MNKKSSVNLVQGCITAISFPRDLIGLKKMVWKNERFPIEYLTDMDLLLYNSSIFKYLEENEDEDEFNWSAPKWMTEGDILFYYHTAASKYWSKRVLRESEEDIIEDNILKNLKHSIEIADKYAGKIFGCSEIAGPTEYYGFQDQHFQGRTFAPVKNVHLFAKPIDLNEFSVFVKISRGGTNTPISRDKDFQEIKKLLSENNVLPEFLKRAKIGDNVFKNIKRSNWKEISCSPNVSFIHEGQIRSYLIDYFLKDIKDPRTPMLEECNCFRNKNLTGTSDYFIKLNSEWIPVEAKVNALAETDINEQLSKYLNVDSFIPTMGVRYGERYNDLETRLCLLIDQSGLYTFYNDDFCDCNLGKPLWHRHELKNTQFIRNRIIEILK